MREASVARGAGRHGAGCVSEVVTVTIGNVAIVAGRVARADRCLDIDIGYLVLYVKLA
jgi:hypothetical protein